MTSLKLFGGKPTHIRPSAEEYLSPSQRSKIVSNWIVYKTHWTQSMLLRLQELDHSGLTDMEILIALRECFDAPATVKEIWQERAFLKTGPRTDATWTSAMVQKLIDLSGQGMNAQQITEELLRVYQRPASWAETYRKMQVLKLDGVIE
ncbi:MAG: hypothetical protein Q9201_002723 [Fulgogasparrea decipioides]